jgi:hypothetical protein
MQERLKHLSILSSDTMKKFLIKLSYTVLPVFLLLFGLTAYLNIYIRPQATGDLGRLGFVIIGEDYGQRIEQNELKDTLFEKVRETDDLKNIHVNVLTIGDSFSQQEHAGYQNYMALEGLTVANTRRDLYDNPIQYSWNVLEAGVVDSTNIDVMVVEVGERDLAIRIDNFRIDKVEKGEPDMPDIVEEENVWDIRDWSLLRTRDFLMYRYAGRNPVYDVKLNRDFFDSNEPRRLYFYCADITNGISIEESIRPKFKKVFDLLTKKAHERGVALILMVPVDKYDLYQEYIVDNPYDHPKRINEEVRELLGDIPEVLLSKYYLQPLIERGEKDVFLFDNSHWSYKASEAVGKELSRRVKMLSNN